MSEIGLDDGTAAPTSGLGGFLYSMRVTPTRWQAIGEVTLARAAWMAAGGWLLAAFARFGIQGFDDLRAVTRFVLVGLYGWLAMAAVATAVVVGSTIFGRRSSWSWPSGPGRIIEAVGLSHQPLTVTAMIALVGQLLPPELEVIVTIVAVLAFGLWWPATLVAALTSISRSGPVGLVAGLVSYAFWVGTAGRYLLDRAGHLI